MSSAVSLILAVVYFGLLQLVCSDMAMNEVVLQGRGRLAMVGLVLEKAAGRNVRSFIARLTTSSKFWTGGRAIVTLNW
jgi:hypothetical protein